VTTVTFGRRLQGQRRGPLPLWAWPLAGLCLGLLLALALTPGAFPLVLAAVVLIGVVAARPWTAERRRLDDMHERIVASRPLSSGWEHSSQR
jgi:hypothetical protein